LKNRVRLFLTIVLLSLASAASAIPRFSLITGTRCSACHFNPQGSGLRTELGWQTMNDVGIVKWRGEGTSGITPTNALFGGKVFAGGDARLQLVRSSKTGEELLIPMQLALSLAIVPSHEVAVYTNVNTASIAERARGGSLYPGESDFDAAIQYQPDITWPSIRVGMIQPSISVRQDDHTLFTHMEAANQNIALIPPYYNEIGAEITYEGIRWLTVNAGVFNAKNLSEVDPTVGVVGSYFDFAKPSVSARVMLWPQLLDEGLNGELGGSVFLNGDFRLFHAFAGIGLADKASIFVEGLYGKNADDRIVRNFSVIGSYDLVSWLAAVWRFDWGQTEVYPGKSLDYANAFVAGLEIFPMPFIELRPEFRVTQKNPFYGIGTYTGQWTGQIHIFY
jgi:hypothetical protein